ncbi:sugar phosphate isomerase/epimerase [Microbacterium sp. KUDC0406]|uniref:sugar phosphate isomerase/epimerase family protein n=1 Tax=Microbacterium sp. KUDC0406 TaxID=2909588 RepID=UPI001F249A82|nr:sugar phosphate isomerase/epimerase [Microbacterium sp. KUDC0406]UJP10519.1 sugar phosphate isomerase/epimerase [Microbacterium sp. KUDC0406]
MKHIADLKFALNAIQWINVKADPADFDSESLWRFADPAFVAEYPGVLAAIRDAGFDATMLEVLDTQTLQNYAAMIADSGLAVAPGYVQVPLASDHGGRLERGTFERIHWFDAVRRKAEESNYMGLSRIFLAAEVDQQGSRWHRPAVGHDFSQDRLDELTDLIDEAVDVLNAEGVRPGLHNHVGTWIETAQEYEHVLNSIDVSRLGAAFDIGHLEWAGIDSKEALATWGDRVQDLHLKDLDLQIARRTREEGLGYEYSTDLGLYREPGLGDLDLPGILSTLHDDFDGWIIIEVDRASMDPADSAHHTARWVAEATKA